MMPVNTLLGRQPCPTMHVLNRALIPVGKAFISGNKSKGTSRGEQHEANGPTAGPDRRRIQNEASRDLSRQPGTGQGHNPMSLAQNLVSKHPQPYTAYKVMQCHAAVKRVHEALPIICGIQNFCWMRAPSEQHERSFTVRKPFFLPAGIGLGLEANPCLFAGNHSAGALFGDRPGRDGQRHQPVG